MKKQEFMDAVRDAETTMYHVAMSILKNYADCADAVQEALMIAFEKLHTLKVDAYFKTWIIRILIRECYRIQKKRKNLVPYEEYMQDRKLWEEDRYTDLYLAIMELPQELRVLVTLYYLDGFSVREVSDILQMKEVTVKSRLSRAREQLRVQLGDREGVLC